MEKLFLQTAVQRFMWELILFIMKKERMRLTEKGMRMMPTVRRKRLSMP